MVRAGQNDNEFYVFGGLLSQPGMRCNDTRCNELWSFNVEVGIWSLETTGAPSVLQDAGFESTSKVPTEKTTEEAMPCPRSGQSMVNYAEDHKIVIFGGRSSKSADSDMNDLWAYDVRTKFWQKLLS